MQVFLGVLFLIFIVLIIPSPARAFVGALLLVCVVLALIGLATGYSPR